MHGDSLSGHAPSGQHTYCPHVTKGVWVVSWPKAAFVCGPMLHNIGGGVEAAPCSAPERCFSNWEKQHYGEEERGPPSFGGGTCSIPPHDSNNVVRMLRSSGAPIRNCPAFCRARANPVCARGPSTGHCMLGSSPGGMQSILCFCMEQRLCMVMLIHVQEDKSQSMQTRASQGQTHFATTLRTY